MSNITVSKPNGISVYDGNSLAIYVDADTGVLSLRDIYGRFVSVISQIEKSNIISQGVISGVLLTREKIEENEVINIEEFYQYNLVSILINDGIINNEGTINIL